MLRMFRCAESFNQYLDNWDVSNVIDMEGMFFGALTFNQPLEKWNVSKVLDMTGMFKKSELERTDNLPSWYKI
jgi:surface protein